MDLYTENLIFRKRLALVSLSLICITAFLCFVLPTLSFASFGNDLEYSMVSTIMDCLGGDQITYCKDILLGTNSGFQDAVIGENGFGSVIASLLTMIGGGFTLVHITKEFFKLFNEGDLDFDMWLKLFTRAVVALTVIINCGAIFDAIRDFGNALVEVISNSTILAEAQNFIPEGGYEPEGLLESAVDVVGGAFNGIFKSVDLMIPCLLLKLDNIVVKTISYSLFIEFAIRRAFAPIAVADVISEGPRSPGIRYFKKFFGIYIKMGIILLSIGVSWQLIYTTVEVNSLFTGGFVALYDVTSLLAAGKLMMNNASIIADEILGV